MNLFLQIFIYDKTKYGHQRKLMSIKIRKTSEKYAISFTHMYSNLCIL